MTRPSDHYPRRCGCGHHAADPLDTITLGPGRVVPLDEVIRRTREDGAEYWSARRAEAAS